MPQLRDEPGAASTLVGVGARLGASSTTAAGAAGHHGNSRRSSSSRSRLRSDWATGPVQRGRSNIGSGRDRLGKLPSTAPTTSTVSNSVPWRRGP